jgi:DNA polymerase III delta subunit
MAVETALAFLRGLEKSRELPPLIVIAGPNAFLREYTLDALSRTLRRRGFEYRAFQAGNSNALRAVVSELSGGDLFAARRLIACRILKSNRDGDDEAGPRTGRARADTGGDDSFAGFVESFAGPNHLAILYERDTAAAKIRRIAERAGLLINCARPFDNQLGQYADEFARSLELRLAADAREQLVESFGGDLSAMVNVLAKAAINLEPGGTVKRSDLAEPAAGRAPEIFDIADRFAHGDLAGTLTMVERATALGRDTLEILAVELTPILRRMLTAADVLAAGKSPQAAASALGMPPGSSFAMRAIDGARRFGAVRLERAHRNLSVLDASIKDGRVKETREALCGLIMDLMAPTQSERGGVRPRA